MDGCQWKCEGSGSGWEVGMDECMDRWLNK